MRTRPTHNTLALTLAAGFAAALTAQASAQGTPRTPANPQPHAAQHAANATPNLVQVAQSAGTFNTLIAAVKAAGLADTLMGPGPFTVFAPTDEAFAKLPKGTVENLLEPGNLDLLRAILTYHVVPGSVKAADVVKLTHATTVNGQRADIKVDNGTVRVDTATVLTTDITASNGVIHVIDSVILPVRDDIPTIASSAGSFNTLLAAVTAAGLAETLMGPGPFTVFAPTDAAFSKLGSTVQELLQPANRDRLKAVLTYHVLPGRVYSDQAIAAKAAKTLQGGEVKVTSGLGVVKINDARVVTADIEASNGVIHVIDTVLLPQ